MPLDPTPESTSNGVSFGAEVFVTSRYHATLKIHASCVDMVKHCLGVPYEMNLTSDHIVDGLNQEFIVTTAESKVLISERDANGLPVNHLFVGEIVYDPVMQMVDFVRVTDVNVNDVFDAHGEDDDASPETEEPS